MKKNKPRVRFYHIRLLDFIKRCMLGVLIAGGLFLLIRFPFWQTADLSEAFKGFSLPKDMSLKGAVPFLYNRIGEGDLSRQGEQWIKDVFLKSTFPVYGLEHENLTYLNSFNHYKFHEDFIPGKSDIQPAPEIADVVPEGAKPIEKVTLVPDAKEGGYQSWENILLNNNTKFSIDIPALWKAKLPYTYQKGKMQVLILHTHTTESYAREGSTYYTEEDTDRSQNPQESVVAVGDVIAEELIKQGIGVIHDTTVHDFPSFTGSYSNAEQTIEKRLKETPSIVMVLDVHRDALITKEGVKYRPVVSRDGKDYAQVMLVMGTNEGGLEFDKWNENLKTAFKVQKGLEETLPGIARPLFLAPQRYNEHLSPGSMLIEVGGCGNYLSDAKNSAKVIAEVIAGVVKGE